MPRRACHRATKVAWVLAGCLASHAAGAEEEPAAGREPAAAEALFAAGHAAMDAGDYDTACQKFAASLELDPAPGTLLNLGNCEEKRGKVASAWERYIAAERELPESDRRRQFARDKVKELESRVPHLTIVLADGAPESTTIHRGEIDLTGSLGVALPLDPGSYTIRAAAPGYEERTFDLDLALGESRELDVAPGDRVPEPAPTFSIGGEDPQRFGPLTQMQWGYVAGGVGVLGLGAALTTGVLAYGDKQTMDEHCDARTRQCDPAGYEARESGARYALVANVAGGVGLVALGAGLYLILSSESGARTTGSLDGPGRTASVAPELVWLDLPGGQGVAMKGTFW